MSSDDGPPKTAKQAKEDFAVISNRLAVAFAKHESLIKSWTASSSRPTNTKAKTEEELDAEDAALFSNQPPYLGVGAAIPSHFLVSDAERNNKSLRAKFFPTKGLKASKARDAEEKAASAKRGLKDQSSDEEEGRSGLGRAKKLKLTKKPESRKHLVLAGNESAEEEESRSTMLKATKPQAASKDVPHLPQIKQNPTNKSLAIEERLQNEVGLSKVQNTASNSPEPVTMAPRPSDPAELKKWKKREKRKRKKLRDAQKEVQE